MKRKVIITCLLPLLAVSIQMLAACSVDDVDDFTNMATQDQVGRDAVYDGEWTVNKQVVDTARLEVTDVLKLRLPEFYLGISCFEKEHVTSVGPFHSFEYKGLPTIIAYKDQGYTDYALYNSLTATEKDYNETLLFNHASFIVAIDGVDHRVDLLSDEPGNAIYRYDTGQWTIGFTINTYNVTNLDTFEEQVRTPHKPFTLYYSTKNRIR